MCECLQHEDGGAYLCPVCYGMARQYTAELYAQVEWYKRMGMPSLRLSTLAKYISEALSCTPE